MKQALRFSVSLPKELLSPFDRLISDKGYANRSEAMRDLMRNYLVEEEWERCEKETVGTVNLVYDHEKRELDNTLTKLQHQHNQCILSALHIHLDRHNCLEVVVIKGKSSQIRRIADRLISTKGVKYGKLTPATIGEKLT